MAGLASALTTSVLERTREIGILRSIGARARHIRRIFATETIALATVGWIIAIPVGYLLDRFLVWMVKTVANLDVPFTFPLDEPRPRPRSAPSCSPCSSRSCPSDAPSTTGPAKHSATRRTT